MNATTTPAVKSPFVAFYPRQRGLFKRHVEDLRDLAGSCRWTGKKRTSLLAEIGDCERDGGGLELEEPIKPRFLVEGAPIH